MPATYNRPTLPGTANTYDSTTTQLSNSAVRFVLPLIESLDYKDTPLTSMIGFSKRRVDNRKVEWTDEILPAVSDTLGAGYTSGGGTITVSNGAKFQQYNVIQIDSELMLVTAISTNTLTVTTAWAGTTNANHANGAAIQIVGVAMPENTPTPPASVALGSAYNNFCQLWDKGIQISNRQNYANNYFTRTPEYEWRLKQLLTQCKREFERTLFLGVGVDATGTLPSAMSGFPQFITTNVTTLAGAAFTERQFLDALGPAFDDIGPSGLGDTVICGRFAKQVIGSWADPGRRLSGSDTAITARIDTIITDFGELDIMMHRWCPATELYFMNPKNYEICAYANYGEWHDGPLPADGEYLRGHVAGDYVLIAMGNRASAKLTGFSTSSADYSSMAA
ncbi:MAG TPA: DUF5309 family protein [Gemmatimonadaceae bacterium]